MESVYIEHIEDDLYRLVVECPFSEDFTRYCYDEWPDKIEAVDPSGGPYISLGEHTYCIKHPKYKYVKFNVENISVVLGDKGKFSIKETILKISNLEYLN